MARKKLQVIRDQIIKIFKNHGGILKTSEALAAGIHPHFLYELRDDGSIDQLERGVYGLPGLPDIDYPDFAILIKKVPKGVICLITALYFHKLTVQIPRQIDVAVHQKYRPPNITYPPAKFHWFSERVFQEGIEEHDLGGIPVKIYSKEKSIVDCFRLRQKVGIEVAIEALKNYWKQKNPDLDLLIKFAKNSRVYHVMKPYIEIVVHDQS